MSLGAKLKRFLGLTGACRAGRRQLSNFSNVMAAWNGIKDAHLSWLLAELANCDGVTDNNSNRLNAMSDAIDMMAYDDTKTDPDYSRERRIYKSVRSRRNYNFVKTQLMVAMREEERQQKESDNS